MALVTAYSVPDLDLGTLIASSAPYGKWPHLPGTARRAQPDIRALSVARGAVPYECDIVAAD